MFVICLFLICFIFIERKGARPHIDLPIIKLVQKSIKDLFPCSQKGTPKTDSQTKDMRGDLMYLPHSREDNTQSISIILNHLQIVLICFNNNFTLNYTWHIIFFYIDYNTIVVIHNPGLRLCKPARVVNINTKVQNEDHRMNWWKL